MIYFCNLCSYYHTDTQNVTKVSVLGKWA